MNEMDQLRRDLIAFVNNITPQGTAISINGSRILDIEITCDGSDPDMGYYCALPPGHRGQCWTAVKKVNFVGR